MNELVDVEDQIGEISISVKKEIECPNCDSVHVATIDLDGEVEVTVY
jgi:hypothetical protein